jgi:hypothetical protein
MCNFFTLVSKGDGIPLYFDYKIRKAIIEKRSVYSSTDSHTSVADYYGFKGKLEDKLNKYEYNLLTKEFVIDQLNTRDDSKEIEKFCRKLDFKTIVPELIIHPIVNPLNLNRLRVTKKDISLLKEWSSVWDSVWSSVGDSVWDSVRSSVWSSVGSSVRDSVRGSVGDSVRDSVGDSVWDSVRSSVRGSVRDSVWSSVGDSVWDSVRDSVRDSVWSSVGDSVWDSVGDSVWAYISSFFNIEKWKYIDHKPGINPFQSAIDLWNSGLVPSYDGKTWRLHGKGGRILWEGVI